LSGSKACGESVRPVQVCMIEKAVSVKQEGNLSLAKIL